MCCGRPRVRGARGRAPLVASRTAAPAAVRSSMRRAVCAHVRPRVGRCAPKRPGRVSPPHPALPALRSGIARRRHRVLWRGRQQRHPRSHVRVLLPVDAGRPSLVEADAHATANVSPDRWRRGRPPAGTAQHARALPRAGNRRPCPPLSAAPQRAIRGMPRALGVGRVGGRPTVPAGRRVRPNRRHGPNVRAVPAV